jgi:hypothetical protein
MEEAWMRDRALLRDLLRKNPQAALQDLARAIGRKVELGQEMAQALARRYPPRSSPLVLPIAGASCSVFPLGPARGTPHRRHAPLSTRAAGAHSRTSRSVVLSAARP